MITADPDDAAGALRAGQAIGLPTDTVYGVAAAIGAARQLFELKRRPPDVDLPVLVADVAQAELLGVLSPLARRLVARHWPGGLTVVVRRAEGFDAWLGVHDDTVGLRCPAHEAVRELCRRVGPLATTSANLHGEPPCTTAAAVAASFPDLVVLDGGPCERPPSTVVDATGSAPVILRPGTIPPAELGE